MQLDASDLAYTTPELRVGALRDLLRSSVWLELLEPTIRAKAGAKLDELVAGTTETAYQNQLIGWVQALRWMLSWPLAEVQELDVDKEVQMRYMEDDARIASLLEVGRGGPYAAGQPPDEE